MSAPEEEQSSPKRVKPMAIPVWLTAEELRQIQQQYETHLTKSGSLVRDHRSPFPYSLQDPQMNSILLDSTSDSQMSTLQINTLPIVTHSADSVRTYKKRSPPQKKSPKPSTSSMAGQEGSIFVPKRNNKRKTKQTLLDYAGLPAVSPDPSTFTTSPGLNFSGYSPMAQGADGGHYPVPMQFPLDSFQSDSDYSGLLSPEASSSKSNSRRRKQRLNNLRDSSASELQFISPSPGNATAWKKVDKAGKNGQSDENAGLQELAKKLHQKQEALEVPSLLANVNTTNSILMAANIQEKLVENGSFPAISAAIEAAKSSLSAEKNFAHSSSSAIAMENLKSSGPPKPVKKVKFAKSVKDKEKTPKPRVTKSKAKPAKPRVPKEKGVKASPASKGKSKAPGSATFASVGPKVKASSTVTSATPGSSQIFMSTPEKPHLSIPDLTKSPKRPLGRYDRRQHDSVTSEEDRTRCQYVDNYVCFNRIATPDSTYCMEHYLLASKKHGVPLAKIKKSFPTCAFIFKHAGAQIKCRKPVSSFEPVSKYCRNHERDINEMKQKLMKIIEQNDYLDVLRHGCSVDVPNKSHNDSQNKQESQKKAEENSQNKGETETKNDDSEPKRPEPSTSKNFNSEPRWAEPGTSKNCNSEPKRAAPSTSKKFNSEPRWAEPSTSKNCNSEARRAEPSTSKNCNSEAKGAEPSTSKNCNSETKGAEPSNQGSPTPGSPNKTAILEAHQRFKVPGCVEMNKDEDEDGWLDYRTVTLKDIETLQLCQSDSDENSEDDEELEGHEMLSTAGYHTTEELIRLLRDKLEALLVLYKKNREYSKQLYIMRRRHYLEELEAAKKAKTVRECSNPDMLPCNEDFPPEFIANELIDRNNVRYLLQQGNTRGQLGLLIRKQYEATQKKKASSSKIPPVSMSSNDDQQPCCSKSLGGKPMQFGGKKSVANKPTSNKGKKSCGKSMSEKKMNKCKSSSKQAESNAEPEVPVTDKCASSCCTERPLPLTKYCQEHITKDENQVMFIPCGSLKTTTTTCETPVMDLMETKGCPIHYQEFLPDLPLSKEEKDFIMAEEDKQMILPDAEEKVIDNILLNQFSDINHLEEELSAALKPDYLDSDSESEESADDEKRLPPFPDVITLSDTERESKELGDSDELLSDDSDGVEFVESDEDEDPFFGVVRTGQSLPK